MIASRKITNTEILALIVVQVFELLSRKVLLINRKGNRNCYKVGYFKKIVSFTGKLLQNYKQL